MTAKRIGTAMAALTACGGGGSGTGDVQRPGTGAHPPFGEGETVPSRIGAARSLADATVFRTNTVAGVGAVPGTGGR